MGNCQAIDNATLVIQHPCGRVDKLYWPVTASEVMKLNPGHYVALLLTTTTTATANNNNSSNIIRITRIKLLRPTDTLILGQAYRLITTQEVMKGLWAKKYGKMQKKPSEMESEANKQFERVKQKLGCEIEIPPTRSEKDKTKQVLKKDRQRQRTTTSSYSAAAAKSKAWQPSLKSISEATS